jgi:polar amino acid transport system substrate-binding protein
MPNTLDSSARRRAVILPVLVVAAASCGLPRDANGTLERMRGGVMRVGVTDHPPWDSVTAEVVAGVEPMLVAELAATIGARPTWRRGAESELLAALARRELDLVAGGLTDDSPWAGRVALTRPYATDQSGRGHVLAVPAGENGWLVTVERFLQRRAMAPDVTPPKEAP